MSDGQFDGLRGTPRLLELTRQNSVATSFDLDMEPEITEAGLTVQQSLSRKVETQAGFQADRLHFGVQDIPRQLADRLRLVYERTLAPGGFVEWDRDPGRGMLIPGDTATDLRSRFEPIAGSTWTIDALGGRYAEGAVFVSPSDPPNQSRTNLVKNGDMVDVSAGVWTNNTAALLSVAQSSYDRATGPDEDWISFASLGAGTKSAQAVWDSDSTHLSQLPAGGVTVSFLAEARRPSSIALSGLVTLVVIASSGSTYSLGSITPGPTPQRYQFFVDTSAETSTDTTGHVLKATFSDDLMQAPVVLTQLQIEPGDHRSGYITYSTARPTLTGSRPVDVLKYLHVPAYRDQAPGWREGARFELTVAMDFTPGWGVSIGGGSYTSHLPGILIRAGVNDKIDIHRGSTDYHATLRPGQWSYRGMALEIKRAMVAADSGNSYAVAYASSGPAFTISGSSTFSLLWLTGANTATSAASALGYAVADNTGTSTYTAGTADVAVVSLLRDGDITSAGNLPGLRITTTSKVLSCTALLADGSTATAIRSVTWSAGSTRNIIASFQDWDGSTSDSGTLKLSIDGGSTWDTQTHSSALGRLGQILWLGTTQDELRSACGAFSSVQVDPVFIDGGAFTAADFYDAVQPPSRLRTAWRCAMDQAQKGNPVRLAANICSLDLAMLETR